MIIVAWGWERSDLPQGSEDERSYWLKAMFNRQAERLMMAFSQPVLTLSLFLGKLPLVASPGYDKYGRWPNESDPEVDDGFQSTDLIASLFLGMRLKRAFPDDGEHGC